MLLVAAFLFVAEAKGKVVGKVSKNYVHNDDRKHGNKDIKHVSKYRKHGNKYREDEFVVPDHIIILIEENIGFDYIIDNPRAPFINNLASKGALFRNSHGVAHPSLPNYLALFSGSTQGVSDDSCNHNFSTTNLYTELKRKGLSFAGYSEDLPSVGDQICSSGLYAKKHAPWTYFNNTPGSVSIPLSDLPCTEEGCDLPTVSIIVPNLCNDMHNFYIPSNQNQGICQIKNGDDWIREKLKNLLKFVDHSNSLFILTFDEDDLAQTVSTVNNDPSLDINRVATIFYGPNVKRGVYNERIDHYNVLATIQSMYEFKGKLTDAEPVRNWQASTEKQIRFLTKELKKEKLTINKLKHKLADLEKKYHGYDDNDK